MARKNFASVVYCSQDEWTREDFLQLRQQQIDGTILSVDGSHKFVKFVRVRGNDTDTRPIYCVMTILNEFEQVVFQKGLTGVSLREIKEDLKRLFLRYRDGGFKLPRIIYTDMCCDDRALIVEVLEELRDEGFDFFVQDATPVESALPPLVLPPTVEVGPIQASTESDVLRASCDELRTQAAANRNVLGLDIEWEVSFRGGPANPPATIQLAAGNSIVIFQVLHGQKEAPKKLPRSLASLLEDPRVVKTGVGVVGDCTRLQRAYNVDVKNAVDLVKLAASRKVPLGLKRGLAALCSHLLGHYLSKDGFIRTSKWNKRVLASAQLRCVQTECSRKRLFIAVVLREVSKMHRLVVSLYNIASSCLVCSFSFFSFLFVSPSLFTFLFFEFP